MTLTLTVHRGTQTIGGSCIELECAGERLILDAGRPLEAPRDAVGLVPETLDLARPATVLFSHAHLDHTGLLNELPEHWRVMTGSRAAALIRLTANLFEQPFAHTIEGWSSRSPAFQIGRFTVQPLLTDHSGFDAYMLLIEAGGKRLLYSGDFRTHGRKSVLVERLISHPPANIDVLLMEGTNLRSDRPVVSEKELELRFADLAKQTAGQVYVNWSAQNVDRTVTLYNAALRSGRKLVVDCYAAYVLQTIASGTGVPRPGADFSALKVLMLPGVNSLFRRAGLDEVANGFARQPFATSRDRLRGEKAIILLRDSMLRDFERKHIRFQPEDTYAYSNWSGYLDPNDPKTAWSKAKEAGARVLHLHTSGHAGSADLARFAAAMAPRWLVPVHGVSWDDPGIDLPPTKRLGDGEQWEIDCDPARQAG